MERTFNLYVFSESVSVNVFDLNFVSLEAKNTYLNYVIPK